MKKDDATYVVDYWFEWGGPCFWGRNEAAKQKFGYSIEPEKFPLTQKTIDDAQKLIRWHDQSLNWENPSDPGSWGKQEAEDFQRASDQLLEHVRKELGQHFLLLDKREEVLYAFLRKKAKR